MAKQQSKKSKSNTKEVVLIGYKEVMRITGISKGFIYKLMNAGSFPESIHIGEHKVVWIKSEIDSWVNDRIEASRNKGAA